MSTAARVDANRRNAKKSTGPRTGAGKSRVAKNAHRHGLAVPVAALPEFETKVTVLARRIAGENPSPKRAELARRVAEAEVDLQRVRAAKQLLLNGSIKIAPRRTIKETMAFIRRASKALDGDVNAWAQIAAEENQINPSPEKGSGAEAGVARIADAVRELAKLDRYERRALSRRRFAMRDWDALPTPPVVDCRSW